MPSKELVLKMMMSCIDSGMIKVKLIKKKGFGVKDFKVDRKAVEHDIN